MGNAGSAGGRERQKLGELHAPHSPTKDEQAFVFDKKREPNLVYQTSHDEEEPFYTKSEDTSSTQNEPEFNLPRQRSATVTEGTQVTDQVFPTVFKWDGGGKQVLISGTFSNWKTIPMVKSHGDFVTIIDLPEGEHQYKFYVDGEWKHDPGSKVIENGMGSKNNLVSVKNTDFEVFQALAMDSEGGSSNQQNEYSQEIPPMKPWEKPAGPPILPPHLLQVILNKDTPISCEPTLLPEPNHVMLNHLYALSIKDGVMVLSATHRYRKKTPPFRRSNEFLAPYISPVKSSYHVQQFSPHNYNNQQNLNKYEPSKMKYYTCSTPNSSSSNSYGSPYRFNRYNRNNRCSFASANISIYYDPTAMLNPWAELEKEWKGKKEQKLKSANAEDQNNLSE